MWDTIAGPQGGGNLSLAIIFEPRPFVIAESDVLIESLLKVRATFIGVVSDLGWDTSLPLHTLLRATGAPVHFFPAGMHSALLQVLRARSDLPVFGHGPNARADLVTYLERGLPGNRQQTMQRQAQA